MNKKGFAISVVLYSMVILVIGIFYLLLGIVRNRYMVGDTLKEAVINSIEDLFPDNSPENLEEAIEELTLTESDEDGTQFVKGSGVNNNYVWYSGKLWRIVSIDDDGVVKLITDKSMTSITWHYLNSIDYSTSQVHKWLNNEFLPTLANVDDLVVNATWDYTPDDTIDENKPETDSTKVITEKVGLLTAYEYMMCGGTSSFLSEGYINWFTMTPHTTDAKIWYVTYNKLVISSTSLITSAYGVRPAINMMASVKITGGNGNINNPYVVEGDKEIGTESELLSNRVIGEYISFNNTLYRIVGIENGLTKVTMADYSKNDNTLNDNIAFGSGFDPTYDITTGIGKYLDDWYNATSSSEIYADTYISDSYKLMIATSEEGIEWYQGPGDYGASYNYENAKTGDPISATIGMPRYGEMFSTQFKGTNPNYNVWTLTKYDEKNLWYILPNGGSNNVSGLPPNTYGVRPSFYLKSSVKIGDVDGDGNVGTGMPHDPYEITM